MRKRCAATVMWSASSARMLRKSRCADTRRGGVGGRGASGGGPCGDVQLQRRLLWLRRRVWLRCLRRLRLWLRLSLQVRLWLRLWLRLLQLQLRLLLQLRLCRLPL